MGKQGQTRGILKTFQKVKNERLKFVVTETPQKVKVQLKQKKGTVPLNCSYCFQSVRKSSGEGGTWYSQKQKKLKIGNQVRDFASAKLSQLKRRQSGEAREQNEES